jgi:hypothetical protein
MAAPVTAPPTEAVAQDAHWQAKLAKLEAKKPIRRSVKIVLDYDVEQAVVDAQTEVLRRENTLLRAQGDAESAPEDEASKEAVTDAETALEAAKAALEETQTALDEVTVELTFQALPRRAFEKLISENPPTDEARKEGEQYNVDTFVPALIAACSVDGDLDVRDLASDDGRGARRRWVANCPRST